MENLNKCVNKLRKGKKWKENIHKSGKIHRRDDIYPPPTETLRKLGTLKKYGAEEGRLRRAVVCNIKGYRQPLKMGNKPIRKRTHHR